MYGESLPSIQGAIASYTDLGELIDSTNGLDGVNIPEDMFKTLVATRNKFGITSIDDLANYEEIVREYYDTRLDGAETPEDVRRIYSEMLFNATPEEMQAFNEEYCNFNMDELYEYAKALNVEAPITDEFRRRVALYEQIECMTNVDEMKAQFGAMPLVISDVSEAKQRVSSMYSKTYNQEMLDVAIDDLRKKFVEYGRVNLSYEKASKEKTNKQIGFIFQGFNLIPSLTAIDNVELPLVYRGMKKEERNRLSTEALERVGLTKRLYHRPSQMSGGQQQRVAIARAVAAKPPVILADEPTGNLDSASGREVMRILHGLSEEGRTIILITHDNDIANEANRVIRIQDGKIISDTTHT